MKNQQGIYLCKYLISHYDGEADQHIFSSLEKAVKFCEASSESFVENPLNDGYGWLIEMHTIDNPKKDLVFYNQKGQEVKYIPPVKDNIVKPK